MPISRLQPTEGARLRAIRLRALRDAPDAFASTHDETAARPDSSWAEQLRALPTFVATDDQGRDVGMVRFGPDDDNPTTDAWLLSMWVAPEARGLGLSDTLVEAVIQGCRDAGYHRVLLEVGDDNTHAIALYARMGFAPDGVTSRLPPPRDHITEHRRVLTLWP